MVIAGNTSSGSLQPAWEVSNLFLTNSGTLQQHNLPLVAGNTIGNAIVAASGTAAVIVQADTAGVFGNIAQYGGQPYDLWLAGDHETSSGNTWDNWQISAVNTSLRLTPTPPC